MTTFLTPQQIAGRTSAAVDAAVAAGRELGLTVTDPRVLHDVFSVVVHLAPSPVVARIPTVLPHPGDLAALARRQQDERDVTRWLAEQGIPVIAPSPLVPREPLQRDGFSLTFWPFVPEDRDKEPDYVANAESVADLHAAMRPYPGRLEFLSAADPRFIAESLARLDRHPALIGAAELDRARREWQIRSRTGARIRLQPRRAAQRHEAPRRGGPGLRQRPGHAAGRRHSHAGPAAARADGVPPARRRPLADDALRGRHEQLKSCSAGES